MISDGRGARVSPSKIVQLAAGNMMTTDLAAARRFYEEFLGLECVHYAPDRLLLRDSYSRKAMEEGRSDFFLIDVVEVDEITNPQNPLNHWGFTLGSTAEVDRVRAIALERQEEFGIRRVAPITGVHNAYGFFLADRDMNWWEIEFRVHGRTNEMVFDDGDVVLGDKPLAEQGE